MKKLLALAVLVGIVSAASAAVNPTSVSFINQNAGQTNGTLVFVPVAAGLSFTQYINGTNVSSTQGTNSNGVVTNYPPFADAPLWCNGDGSVNNNLNISITTGPDVANSTNAFNVTFVRVADGIYPSTGTAAVDKFTVLVTPNGATQATLVTNIPATFGLAGTKELRLSTIVPVSTVAGSNITFQAISVNGFAP
jgi:uncharacterized membrane protein